MSWPSVSFGDAFEIQLGKMLDEKKNVGDLRPYLGNRNVQWGECEVSGLRQMRFTEADRKKFRLKRGDLLVCEGGEVGRTAVWKGELEECYYQKAVHRLRPIVDVESRFALHFMRWAATRNLFARLTSSTSIAHLTKAKLRKLSFPLPPLEEQKRIAGVLDAADALRVKRREALAQLDTLLQSTFLEMFGDPVTNPMGWEVKALGELGSLDRGVSKHRPRNAASLLGGPYPLVQTGDVADSEGYIRGYKSTYSELGLKQSKIWPAGTLCITIAANIASTGILTFDACFPDSVVGFVSSEEGRTAYVQGLFWFFREILERTAPQVAQKNINLKILRNLSVPLPSAERQRRFATIVESVERQKARYRAHLDELDTLFASLQSRAFRGEL